MAIKSSNQITFTEQKKIVEIREWYLATPNDNDVTITTDGWTLDVQTINEDNPYLWNYEEVVYSIGSSEVSDPVIIGVYGKGSDGKGLLDIKNYYCVTNEPNLPDNPDWSLNVSLLSPTNKYLWNYEEFIYTDETSKSTDPAIIGVYGDSGADAITFEIYSTDGFVFKEDMNRIELKIAAFKGQDAIEDASFKWSYLDDVDSNSYTEIVNDEDEDDNIITSDNSLIVLKTHSYAFSNIKCEMTYNGTTYEDHIMLTDEVVIYSSVVKFFDGSNVFDISKPYLIAYVNLYRNNNLIDTILTNQYYVGENTVEDNIIITDLDTTDISDGDLVYFVCHGDVNYQIVIGKYNKNDNVWNVYNNSGEYIYRNNMYANNASNVVLISKNDISRSQEIEFEIYKKNEDGMPISSTSVIVIDINDPIISSEAPSDPHEGQLWLNTGTNPYELKVFSNNEWVYFSQQDGGAIYTSKPNRYFQGDLWILADGEKCGDFGPGSMLKATTTRSEFNASDWVDAMKENTAIFNDIRQYLKFDPNTGLKIGQGDQKFYVNISSTEMGFYDNQNNQNKKVVYISNESANISNVVVNDVAKFNGEVQFYGLFGWKKESNNSLSLAVL